MKYLTLILVLSLSLASCGGGKDNQPFTNPDSGPDFNISLDSDLASQAVNTLIAEGINITAEPSYLNFGQTTQNKPKSQTIAIKNNSSKSYTLHTSLNGFQSGFKLLDENNTINSSQSIVLAAGTIHNFNLIFSGNVLGNIIGSLVITTTGSQGHILVPLGATVSQASALKIISSQYLCSNKNAPTLDLMDFMRVPSGRSLTKSFKICNTSNKTVRLNSLAFNPNNTSSKSKALESLSVPEFFWDIDGLLEKQFFNYYNPSEDEIFEESLEIDYTGLKPTPYANFYASAINPNDTKNTSTNNQVILASSYLIVDIRFSPLLNIEAPENNHYKPVSFDSQIQLNTSLGNLYVTAVGASAGKEPLLKIIPSRPNELPAACTSQREVDLSSSASTLDFGVASIFEDWIPEDSQIIRLRVCNAGTGAKDLKVWGDPINKGYFTYVNTNNAVVWPLIIAPSQSALLTLAYTPTPKNNITSQSVDLGQLMLSHNASNGPYTALTLAGSQEKASIISVTQAGSILKKSYPSNKGKNFLCAKINSKANKIINITNNSEKNTLTSSITLSQVRANSPIDYYPVNGTVSIKTLKTLPLQTNQFELILDIPKNVPDNTLITGFLEITNTFPSASSSKNLKYNIYFQAKATQSGDCIGGSGAPIDGDATIIIDRITMNLIGPITEPARNPPAFKFHMPLKLFKNEGKAKISGLNYDPTDFETTSNPVKQIRSFAHQITDVTNKCTPLPTNPYKLEFEQGSWEGPDHQCDYKSEDGTIDITSRTACIANNGAQKFEVTDPQLATDLELPADQTHVNVFYHEFAYFGNDCSKPDIEGKISTFYLKEGEKIAAVFQRMQDRFKLNGTEEEYAQITRTYQFDSYIKFNVAFNSGTCNHAAGELVKDPDQIKACWSAFANADTAAAYNFRRVDGFIEECSYFQFEIEEGCGPGDEKSADAATKARCKDVNFADKATWKGYGEYEPDANEENAYNLTLYNVKIDAFTLVHSLNGFFPHEGRLLHSPLYVTLTTKAIGRTSGDSYKGYDWRTLIANKVRSDFTLSNVELDPGAPNTKTYWTESGINGEFTVGESGVFDDHACNINSKFDEHCRGNYELFNGKVLHAGEPIHFDNNARTVLVGLSAFHGKGNLSPGFAKESSSGIGQPLYFTFHACLKPSERDEKGQLIPLDPDAGCYGEEKFLDPGKNLQGGSIIDDYIAAGILPNDAHTQEDPEKNPALINFKIFNEDRMRLTDYFNYDNHYKFDPANSPQTSPCGVGS